MMDIPPGPGAHTTAAVIAGPSVLVLPAASLPSVLHCRATKKPEFLAGFFVSAQNMSLSGHDPRLAVRYTA